MIKTLSLCLLALLFAGQAFAVDLAGITLGSSLEEVLSKYPDAKCESKDKDMTFDNKCGVPAKVANEEVVLIFQSKEGTVGSINAIFEPGKFEAILHELTEKNGQPSSSIDGFAVWGGGNSNELITIEKQSRNIPDSGLLMLMDLKYAKQGGS